MIRKPVFLAIVFLVSIFLAGCGESRDTRTLKQSLLGHWQSGDTHYFIGPDEITMDTNGRQSDMAYTVLELDETENWMLIEVRTRYDNGHQRLLEFNGARDACETRASVSGMVLSSQDWQYVDARQTY